MNAKSSQLPPQGDNEIHETDSQPRDEHLNELSTRKRAAQALKEHNYQLVFKLLESTSFQDGEDLIILWDEAHYREEEKRLGHPLTALSRFRLRQRYPPPLSICPSGKRKSATLPTSATQVLKEWLATHRACPYPNKVEKVALAETCQLSVGQVKTWFANARRRMKKPSKPTGIDVYRCRREGSHHAYRPIAPHPSTVDVTYRWSAPDSLNGAGGDSQASTNINHSVRLFPPSKQALPPISSFFQNKTGQDLSQPQLNIPFLSNCPNQTSWLEDSVQYTSHIPSSVTTLSYPTDFDEVRPRSAFKPVKAKCWSTPNILRPQPIKFLPQSSRIIQQNFCGTPLQQSNDPVNSVQGFAAGVSTQQLDVALTLANMGE